MKILNLVYPDKSDIKYNKIQFPDGQQQVIIGMGGKVTYTSSSPIQIKSRLNNFEDLGWGKEELTTTDENFKTTKAIDKQLLATCFPYL